jgi:ZIP family zinc transporter
VIASSALPIGAWVGASFELPQRLTAALLGFASGALISAVAFELFEDAFHGGGAWRAGLAFLAGATVFIVVDRRLEAHQKRRRAGGGAVGLVLLAAVTLDGVPENLAMGVGLIESTNPALLVAIFVSNFPEAVVGAEKMRRAGESSSDIIRIWIVTAILLAIPVVVGYGALENLSDEALAWPLGFAAGAVLASLADTLMPEAFKEAKEDPGIAYFTALGFLVSYLISAA